MTSETLLNAIALAFPLGGVSELTRKIAGAYTLSFDSIKDDPGISQKDIKALVGHIRRARINKIFIEFAQQHFHQVSCNEKMEGEEGFNNHVELRVGKFLLTHHHQTSSQKMPKDFINLPALYNQVNASLNDDYFERPWFSVQEKQIGKPILNLLLLHETSPEGINQLGNIEFVLPKNSKKLITLSASTVAQKQSEIMDLDEEDLLDFRLRIEREIDSMIA